MSVVRKGTYARLISTKRIGFFGALALIFNAATGPGLPFTPSNFQNPGFVYTTLCFLLFGAVCGFSILFLVEAMQAIPGNRHFQGDVEYATMINFYFEPASHIVGQILLYGALQSNAIQGIVLSAQAFDNMFVAVLGKTCGVRMNFTFMCVGKSEESFPSPFQSTFMLVTAGFLLTVLLVVPLGITSLDDHMWVQYVAMVLSLVLSTQWISTSFLDESGKYKGLDTKLVPAFVPNGAYVDVIGVVMLNYAVMTIIPSWINIKDKGVRVQKAVWSSIIAITTFFIIFGIFVGMGREFPDGNILNVLESQGYPPKLTKTTVYLFALLMLIPSIPVNLIISKDNLVQNQVASERVSTILSYIIPWFIAMPFQTGTLIFNFQVWTSLIFVSTSNFIIPMLIYLRCKKFRKHYNDDRRLSDKQLKLLKKIHHQSSTLVQHIARKEQRVLNGSGPSPPSSSNTPSPIEMVVIEPPAAIQVEAVPESTGTENDWINEDVPDPDMEDVRDGVHVPMNDMIGTLQRIARRFTALEKPASPQAPKTPTRRFTSAETFTSLPDVPEPQLPDLLPISRPIPVYRADDGTSTRLGRFRTLPTNQNFRTPAFRSVPRWMPFQAGHLAWFILVLTSSITLINIILKISNKK